MVDSACRLGLVPSASMEGNSDLALGFCLLFLVGCLALDREEGKGFDAEGSSILRKGHCQRRVMDSAIKTNNFGTPSGYFSRRRRIITTFFKLALKLSL